MVVAGPSGAFWTALVVPVLTPIKALRACLAGLGVVSVDDVRDFSRCLSRKAAAAVIGAGFERGRLPGLGDESFEDSRIPDGRLGGFDGLAKFADVPLPPAAGDTVEVSVEGSEGFGEDPAIKRPSSVLKNSGWKCLGNMDREGGVAEATRDVDILAELF
jgi:hypothetical protein